MHSILESYLRGRENLELLDFEEENDLAQKMADLIVAEGINSFRTKDKSFILITHYHRIIKYLSPDYVHVMLNGKIAKSGGEELAIELEERGYDWINNQ